jgi:CHASE3 domain sensor protein
LEPYDTSLATTPLYLDLLEEQLGGQNMNLIDLRSLILNISQQWNITITDRMRPNGFELSRNDTLTLQGKATMDEIRTILTAIQTREALVVDNRYSDAKSSLLFITVVTAVSLALIILTVLGGVIIGLDMDSKGLRKHNEQLTVLLQKAEEATALKSVFLAVRQHT